MNEKTNHCKICSKPIEGAGFLVHWDCYEKEHRRAIKNHELSNKKTSAISFYPRVATISPEEETPFGEEVEYDDFDIWDFGDS